MSKIDKITISTLQARKDAGEKFSVIAAYDASFAKLIEEAGVDAILIGDSLGMVLQGHDSTLPVSINDIAYHTRCVSAGCENTMVIADLPFGSYNTWKETLTNSSTLMKAGANMVKLEGGDKWVLENIDELTKRGIPVCAHLGLTPQSVNAFSGFKIQGREPDRAQQILQEAKEVEAAGASMVVLECVPASLANEITAAINIPVIGIGAGNGTDAQVLVLYDMLGMYPRSPRFVKDFLVDNNSILGALQSYDTAVKNGTFPCEQHTFN